MSIAKLIAEDIRRIPPHIELSDDECVAIHERILLGGFVDAQEAAQRVSQMKREMATTINDTRKDST